MADQPGDWPGVEAPDLFARLEKLHAGDDTARYINFERTADEIRTFEDRVVPGMLQSPRYATLVFDAFEGESGNAAEKAKCRTDRLSQISKGAKVSVVLAERVVCDPLGGDAEVQREQIAHLVEVVDNKRITVRILPKDARVTPGVDGPLALLRRTTGWGPLADTDTVGFVECQAGHIWVTKAGAVEKLTKRFAAIDEKAMTSEDSMEYLSKLHSRLSGPDEQTSVPRDDAGRATAGA